MRKKTKARVLFICNTNYIYSFNTSKTEKTFSGLFNSASMVSDMLNESGVESKIVKVVDANSIDREVSGFKPTIVVIEAVWVTPAKLAELGRLHKHVLWVVRVHSELPFIANEGMTIEWLKAYVKQDRVIVSCNSERAFEDLDVITGQDGLYLPNYYKTSPLGKRTVSRDGYSIDIACFGAIRPMKNQLLQAVAAIKFASELGYKLRFHVNSSRLELGGESVIKNIRALFKDRDDSLLIEHPWVDHKEFKRSLVEIDLGMQVSLSETFNIVTADMVDCGVPVVVSKEVTWVDSACFADSNSVNNIVRVMKRVWEEATLVRRNYVELKTYTAKAKETWLTFIQHES